MMSSTVCETEISMALKPISEIRRQELMAAALKVVEMKGFAGATLEQVAKQAGASKGIVLHYFKNKQQLFEQAMRYGNAKLRRTAVERLREAHTPHERLWAVIAVNFDDEFFRPELCQAWLSLCAEVPHNDQFRRLQVAIHARMNSNLVSALRQLLPDEDAREYAIALSGLVDGLWLRRAIHPDGLTREVAFNIIRQSISERIPNFQSGAAEGADRNR